MTTKCMGFMPGMTNSHYNWVSLLVSTMNSTFQDLEWKRTLDNLTKCRGKAYLSAALRQHKCPWIKLRVLSMTSLEPGERGIFLSWQIRTLWYQPVGSKNSTGRTIQGTVPAEKFKPCVASFSFSSSLLHKPAMSQKDSIYITNCYFHKHQ